VPQWQEVSIDPIHLLHPSDSFSGVDSGFMINDNMANPGPTFDVPVTSTEPTWMFCKQANHCGEGMVFAINPAPVGDKTMEAYVAKAVLSGPPKQLAALQMVNAQQQAVASTVTVAVAGAAGAATAASAGAPMATVASGQGTAPNGETCSCQCLCGQNSFPQNVGQGEFGGFLGTLIPQTLAIGC